MDCISSQENPKIITLEGVLVILNTIELLWPSNKTSKSAVL